MRPVIGMRIEDKNEWEKRAPLVPKDVEKLIREHNIEVLVQDSPIRIFINEEYEKAGAKIVDDLDEAPIIFGVKEMPEEIFEENKTYIFFSHTIKGQEFNMSMLKRMMNLRCNLFDYEKIENEKGFRLIFFGQFAGLAGMIQTFWALGKRLKWEGIENPFEEVEHTYKYMDLEAAKDAIEKVGQKIKEEGIPTQVAPLIIGVTGYGHVSQGAQEILGLLPIIEIEPNEIEEIYNNKKEDRHHIYKVVFKEEHMVKPLSEEVEFELQDYYDNPEKYESQMERYLPYLTVLVNSIYWDPRYPRVVTKEFLKELLTEQETPNLRVIGDISCDIEGAIECTTHETKPNKPTFVYNPFEEGYNPGVKGKGVVVMAVDNLPCELARESSTEFSHVLTKFVPAIAKADYSVNYGELDLPAPIKRALILYHGELTEDYKYMESFL